MWRFKKKIIFVGYLVKTKYFLQVSCLTTAEDLASSKINYLLGSGLRSFLSVCLVYFLASIIIS